MEHVSGIIQSIMGTIACPTCEATDQEGGPVPDATDRKRWLDTTGLLVTCPMCDNGEIYWEEHSPYSWEARREDCEHCEGKTGGRGSPSPLNPQIGEHHVRPRRSLYGGDILSWTRDPASVLAGGILFRRGQMKGFNPMPLIGLTIFAMFLWTLITFNI